MSADLDSTILAPLVVFFAGVAAVACGKVYLLGNEKKALKRKISELTNQLTASEEHRKEHLNVALDHYREEVERQQKQFEIAKMSHDEVKEFARFLLGFIERKHPGWLQDRLDGKPEYELVITEPNQLKGAALVKSQMRPSPPPRSTKGAVNPPTGGS